VGVREPGARDSGSRAGDAADGTLPLF